MTAKPGNVVLVGPRAAGKSTLAPPLAAALDWTAEDSDRLLAARVGQPAAEFLVRSGEAAFREVEADIVAAALASTRRVLALGGGAVLSAATRALLVAPQHFVVFLDAPVEVLVARLQAPGAPARPALTCRPLADEVATLLAQRRPLYESVSDLILDTFSANVPACIQTILARMGRPVG